MKIPALSRCPVRLRAALSGGFGLVLALGAVASSSSGAVAGTHAAARARAVAPGGAWGQAEEVPGLAALNADGRAEVVSLSCARAGDCGAGGDYTDSSGRGEGFVVSETDAVWGQAEAVPGLAALNASGSAGVTSVSCASAGDCSAGGVYVDASGFQTGIQGFVVGETDGVWGQAEEVPGLAALNTTGHAEVTSVSCARPGDCSAVGHYRDSSFAVQGFVVSEADGVWGQAEAVPGLAALNTGGRAEMTSVSCARPGDCSAGGDYTVGFVEQQGFVVSETDGVWGQAEAVPGLVALNRRGLAAVRSVSCASAGDCSGGGFYQAGSHAIQGFVVNETNGVWGQAEQVPGLAALSTGGGNANAEVTSVSCARPGECSAAGSYTDPFPFQQGFVVNETNGVWGKAKEVPGLAALRTGRSAAVLSVSCTRPGDCSAGGFYEARSLRAQGFVASETDGIWGQAGDVPGLKALNTRGDAPVLSVSCARPGDCSAGGFYIDAAGIQGFVVSAG